MRKKYIIILSIAALIAGGIFIFNSISINEKEDNIFITTAIITDNDLPSTQDININYEWRINPTPKPIQTPLPILTPLPASTPKPIQTPKPGHDRTSDENQIVQFEVMLTTTSGQIVECDYTTVDGTAKAGEDFIAVSGRVIIPEGETLFLVPVQIIQDDIKEQTEYFYVEISNPFNAVLGKTVGKCLIYDSN